MVDVQDSVLLEQYHSALVGMGATELLDLAELSEVECTEEVGMKTPEVRRLKRALKSRGLG